MLTHNEKFQKSKRLLSSEEYKNVFSESQRFVDRTLLIQVRPNDLGFPRLGLIIKKKHVKRATDRNRIKRVVREYFRKNQDIQGLDIIVTTREGAKQLSNDEIRGCLYNLWKKLNEFFKQ